MEIEDSFCIREKKFFYHRTDLNINMSAVSLFWDTNMVDVMLFENSLYWGTL